MQLSVVIPAFNEGHRILSTIDRVAKFCERELSQWEIIVIDDGSIDDTSSVVSKVARVRLLRNERNRGKGYSVRRGMLEARLDPVLVSDADLSTPIEEALQLLAALDAGAQVAIASRIPSQTKIVRRTPGRKLMAMVFRMLVKVIVLRGFHDTQCGFKMFRLTAAQEIFPHQRLERWGFDVEVLYLARRLGFQVVEVPVTWHESTESRLKWTTPLTMLGDLFTIRWNDLLGRYPRRK